MPNIFQDNTKMVPKSADPQIVRVPMDQLDVGGRKSHLPNFDKNGAMSVVHVPNQG
jgi:hypothetical protein